MPRADWKYLLGTDSLVPGSQMLNLFGDAIKPILGELRNLALSNRQLACARDLILPRLMNGEIAV